MDKRTIPAFQLLLSGIMMLASSTTWALGLGNIELQSHLGEPLRARVMLNEAPQSLSASCFKLLQSSDNHPSSALNADILLREDGTGNTSLLISSYQILANPIVQLTLIAHCENQIAREYVLLLDPPQFHESVNNEIPAPLIPDTQTLPTTINEQASLQKRDRQFGQQAAIEPQTLSVKPRSIRKKTATRNSRENHPAKLAGSSPEPASISAHTSKAD